MAGEATREAEAKRVEAERRDLESWNKFQQRKADITELKARFVPKYLSREDFFAFPLSPFFFKGSTAYKILFSFSFRFFFLNLSILLTCFCAGKRRKKEFGGGEKPKKRQRKHWRTSEITG